MKRILLDQGLAPRTGAVLQSRGWDAVHTSEIGLDRAEDSAILENADRTGRVCITLDHDFHAYLALNAAKGPSVVLIRAEGLGAEQQVELIEEIWKVCEAALEQGAAVSADQERIRIRRLPLR